MLLARRNLVHDPVRLALSIAGVAVPIALILLLAGYRAGVYAQASAYLDHAPGEYVVAEPGTANFMGTTSALDQGIEDRVAVLPGITRVVPVITQFVVFEQHGRKEGFLLVGYDPARGGGPWQMTAGRELTADDEVVLDDTTARQHGINVGDSLRILDRDVAVVGLSGETTFWAGSIGFARLGTLESFLRAGNLRSFLLVSLEPGAREAEVRADVAALRADLVPKATLIANDRRLLARVYDAPIGLMVIIAFAVGVLVVGLVIYTAAVERRREYGALKAIGAPNRVLYRVVVAQALLAAVSGALAGTGLALGGSVLLTAWRPQFRVEIDAATVVGVSASSLVMAVVAALAPALSLGALEPAEVFRG